jgi:hypothetical protein
VNCRPPAWGVALSDYREGSRLVAVSAARRSVRNARRGRTDWRLTAWTRAPRTTRPRNLYTGDFRQLWIGVRPQLGTRVARHRIADNTAVKILAYLRADVQLAHPEALEVTDSLLPRTGTAAHLPGRGSTWPGNGHCRRTYVPFSRSRCGESRSSRGRSIRPRARTLRRRQPTWRLGRWQASRQARSE